MILKEIELENIRSYENQKISFTEKSTLLSGDIGSGKTSVLLGIEFALFGLQPGQRGSAILKNGKKEGRVKLIFEVDGKEVIVERTLKRGKSISQDYCSITIGEEKKELSVTELKGKVLELLNYPSEFAKKQNLLYKFTVYTPQEEMKEIILQDSETRIDTLRHIFGIDKYKRILENTAIITAKLREEKRMKEGMTSNLEQLKIRLNEKEENLDKKKIELTSAELECADKINIKKNIESEMEEIYKKIEEKNKLQSEIEKTKLMIINKNDSILSNRKNSETLKKQIEDIQVLKFDEFEINDIEKGILLNKKRRDELNNENLEISSKINSLMLKIDDNAKLERKISNLEICPTCLQNVEAVYRANVQNKIHQDNAEHEKQIKELAAKKEELRTRLKKTESEISESEKRITELKILKIKIQNISEKQMQMNEIGKLNVSLEKDIELLKQHVELLTASIMNLGRFVNVYEEKQKELDEARNNEKHAEIKIAELKKEIEVFSENISLLKKDIEKTEAIKSQLNYIIELENWLSKQFIQLISFIEKNVMIKLKTEFSKLFAEWFYILVSDNFNVHLDDNFNPVIEQHDYEIDYAHLSGGERTAIALAYRLSLNQVINSLMSKIKTRGLIILDEPTDGFSEQQLDKMRDVLQQLEVKQLIIVSHEQKIEGFVEHVIKFKKVNGITQVESS